MRIPPRQLCGLAIALSLVWAARGLAQAAPAGCADAADQAVIRGTVRTRPHGFAIRGAIVTVLGTACRAESDAAGAFVLRGVPAGRQVVSAAFIGYRLQADTIRVQTADSLTLVLTLPEPEEISVYTHAPMQPADRRAVMAAAFNFYQAGTDVPESELVERTLQITSTPHAAADTGARPVMWLGGSAPAYRADATWARAHGFLVCLAADYRNCRGHGLTSFLSFKTPSRVSPDSVFVEVREAVVDPVACRRGGAFVGFDENTPLVVHDVAGWHGVRFLDNIRLAGSGYCARPAR